MKSLLYIALVLCALMVAASLDAVPDPPAVNSHGSELKLAGLLEVPDAAPEPRLHGASPFVTHFFPLGRLPFIETIEASRPSDHIAWLNVAGDSSPPVSL